MTRNLTRRGALGAGLLGSFAGLPLAAAPVPPLDNRLAGARGHRRLPADPAAQNRALIKLLGDSAGGRVVWKSRGVIYAIQPDKVTPLYAMLGSESSWWRQTGDNEWIRFPSTLSFFRDLSTGEWLENFANPLNGKTVKLPASYIRHKEGEVLTPNGRWFPAMKLAFPDSYREAPLNLHWSLEGDTVRIHEPSNFPPILPQPSLECATLFGSAKDMLSKKASRSPGQVAGWNVFAWHPYLDMGGAAGHILWHFDAVKVGGVEELDEAYLARARAFTPLFDRSPEIDEGPTFFERILQRRKAASSS